MHANEEQATSDWAQSWDDYANDVFSDAPAGGIGPGGGGIGELIGQRPDMVPAAAVAEMSSELEQLRGERVDQACAAIEERFPALREPEVLDAVIAAAQQLAFEWGDPEAWRHPRTILQVIMNAGGDAGADAAFHGAQAPFASRNSRMVADLIAAHGGTPAFKLW